MTSHIFTPSCFVSSTENLIFWKFCQGFGWGLTMLGHSDIIWYSTNCFLNINIDFLYKINESSMKRLISTLGISSNNIIIRRHAGRCLVSIDGKQCMADYYLLVDHHWLIYRGSYRNSLNFACNNLSIISRYFLDNLAHKRENSSNLDSGAATIFIVQQWPEAASLCWLW